MSLPVPLAASQGISGHIYANVLRLHVHAVSLRVSRL